MIEVKPGRYIHFKGGEYEVLFIAKHTETEEDLVVYRALYGENKIWARPISMFNDSVKINGYVRPRFTYIEK